MKDGLKERLFSRSVLSQKEATDKLSRNRLVYGSVIKKLHWTYINDMFGKKKLRCTYPCEPPCQYTSKSVDNIKGHVNSVHIKKQMHCNVCGSSFLNYKGMKDHMRKVHKKFAYSCTFQPCIFKSFDTELIKEHYWEK